MKLLSSVSFAVACLAAQAASAALTHRLNSFTITEHPDPEKRTQLQDVVSIHLKDGSLAKAEANLFVADYVGQPIALHPWRTDYDF
jgi:hypothetical protein